MDNGKLYIQPKYDLTQNLFNPFICHPSQEYIKLMVFVFLNEILNFINCVIGA